MNYLDYLSLFLLGGLGSAINSVAGGGTFLTFPMLMFMGLSPMQANIASTIALWPGSVASAVAYRKGWMEQRKALPSLILISGLGSVLGAVVLLTTPEQRFAQLVPWLMLVATLIFIFGRSALSYMKILHHPAVARAMQLIISFYGGYFGAGIGILMLAMLQLMGMSDIHKMNALKTVLGSTINAVAVVIFIVGGAVVWAPTLTMLAGALIGGYAGAAIAQRFPAEPVRLFVSVIAVAMTAWFFIRA